MVELRNMENADTIVAVATPAGEGGLAVVRLSGPGAFGIADALLPEGVRVDPARSHRALLAVVSDPRSGEALDEVVVLPMAAPNSYTGEQTVEFFCHGGSLPARMVVDACCAAAARPAAAGEFTRRAFLNGRLTLDQAEAVADLIHAENRLAAKGALRQLRGGFSREIEAVEAPLLSLLAELEGGLEFGEEEGLDVPAERIVQTLDASLRDVDRLLGYAAAGRRLRDGVQVVLVGAPNAGKSSLFNALLGERRALVDHEAGTTRDVVDARMDHGGCHFVLRDTAGLRDNAGRVEAMGVDQAREAASSADLVLHVVDLTGNVDVAKGDSGATTTAATELRVGAKADVAPDALGRAADAGLIVTSSRDGRGLDALKNAMFEAVEGERLGEAASLGVVLNDRHAHKLRQLHGELVALHETVTAGGADQEVVCTLLQGALCNLGEVTGRVFSEALLGEVFSRFCVGK